MNSNRNWFYLFLFFISLLYSCDDHSHQQTTYTEPTLPVYFDSIETNDELIAIPGKQQTLKEFILSKPARPSDTQRIIYLRPIGAFTPLQNQQIELLRTYLQTFYQLPTRTLKPLPSDTIPSSARRYTGNDQLLAGYILDSLLKENVPQNGILLMGVSELDLYPKPEWMYVFGLASYTNHVAVCSIFRMQGYELTDTNFNLCMQRLLKVGSHEAGHAFGLHHCVQAKCVMNFSNSLPDLDQTTARLCSSCQRKIYSNFLYPSDKRNKELAVFYKKTNWMEEFKRIEKDLNASQ